MVEIIISAFAIIGGLLSIVGSIGLLRLPDVYLRIHAVSKNATLGVIMIMVATFLFFLLLEGEFIGKILLTILFVFLTAPVAGLMISRAAYRIGTPLFDKTSQDDLKKVYEKKAKRT
ncbi:monovalent cation/H(+) antiporter subunit G [Halalkalibacterium ligniniphilum]|uniref:monovalent cation/H(+) antiporter subunit G n=1 Tax=Halalkalibacterium ligniniphilum TaxID=1134413 RepID=UPI00034660EA|nr:monovalent cation/H(+) antiporter subunit G [Halalkalibacterium ligniniphilum]